VAVVLVASCLAGRAEAGGGLDPAFGARGKVVTHFNGSAHAMATQADGKLVAGGATCEATGSPCDFALVRYNSDGSLDATFGDGGKVVTVFGSNSRISALVVQTDGKLVAAGFSCSTFCGFALVRYHTDGSLDSAFGDSGRVLTLVNAGSSAHAKALVLQPDGKLVAAGDDSASGTFVLARYDSDGNLDPTFGAGGLAVTDFCCNAHALILQPDGKLVAAGSASDPLEPMFGLARFNTDGSPDSTFGTGGTVVTGISGNVAGLALQADGKLVAVGGTRLPGAGDSSDFGLARFHADGAPDGTFGAGGVVTTNFRISPRTGSRSDDTAAAVSVQSDGKLLAAGSSNAAGTYDFALARYLPDGSLDATFGSGGKVTTNMFGSDNRAVALAIAADGKLVAVGWAVSRYYFALARYLP
jgi:uncharacterized delta-60 repeat protein